MTSITGLNERHREEDQRVPRWAALFRRSLTPWAAMRGIAAVTLAVALAGAVLMRTFDGAEFPTFGAALWWAAQTVTTVGYGDVVPSATSGRIVAVVLMLSGLGFLTVSTAAISATLIEGARRRLAAAEHARDESPLEEIRERLERLEAALSQRPEHGER